MRFHPSNWPFVYNLQQELFGEKHCKTTFLEKYVKLEPKHKLLDIGCGTGAMLDYMDKKVSYTGFDLDADYIDHAKNKYGKRGTFICEDVEKFSEHHSKKFDRCISVGVLHHLTDNQVASVFQVAKKVLKKGGYLVTMDPCYHGAQGWLERRLLANDRGRYIRSTEHYLSLIRPFCQTITHDIRKDLLRLPYTKIIIKYEF